MALVIITILLPLIFLIIDIYKERKIYSPSVIFNGIFFVTLLFAIPLGLVIAFVLWNQKQKIVSQSQAVYSSYRE